MPRPEAIDARAIRDGAGLPLILSDRDLSHEIATGRLVIVPRPLTEDIQPASIDVHLGCAFKKPTGLRFAPLDVRKPDTLCDVVDVVYPPDYPVTILPGDFFLGTTVERVCMPNDLVARVEGRSSLGRLGLTVHVTAGFIDPGFEGRITLELCNLNRYPLVIYTGMRIAQLAFERMTSPARRPYGHPERNNKYQGQETVTLSRIGEEK